MHAKLFHSQNAMVTYELSTVLSGKHSAQFTCYVSYGSQKLNLNRRGRFSLSLSDMYSVYTFVSMLQKIVGF